MKKKIATILFTLAILIFIILGFLVLKDDVKTSTTSDTENASCHKITDYTFPDDIKILWNDSKYYVSYDSTLKSIQLNTWALTNKQFTHDKISELPLQCEKPDFNCLAKNVHLEIKEFSPPYGVLTLELNNLRKIIPFSWDSKKSLRLGAPLQLCGKNILDIEKGKFFWLQNNLFFYDYQKNAIGQYDMSKLSGATFSSAAVDAGKILTLTDEGFIQPSNCDTLSLNPTVEPYTIQTEKDHVLIYKPNAIGVAYSYKNDFIPLFKTASVVSLGLSDDEHKSIFYTDAQNLFKLTSENLQETQIAKDIPFQDLSIVRQNKSSQAVFSQIFQKLVLFSPKKMFNSDALIVINLKSKYTDHINGGWSVYKKDSEYNYAGILSAEDAFYFSQRSNSAAEFVAATCLP